MTRIKDITKTANDFFKTGIWGTHLAGKSRIAEMLLTGLKIIILSTRGFMKNQGQLRASALTFWTLLSIVPLVAMAFGISKGFGFEGLLERFIVEEIPVQEEMTLKILQFSKALLENTRGGVIAGIGVVFLFWSAIRVLSNIEQSFNHIWGIDKNRTFARKLGDYLAFMLISPVLVISSSSMTVFITTQVEHILTRFEILGLMAPVIFFGLRLIPYLLIWVLFSLMYWIIPNTRVNITSAFTGGVVAGTVFHIAQWGYIYFQVGVTKANAIYGSFAAIPLFLIWLQMSWFIVLIGTEFSCAHQNIKLYKSGFKFDNLSFSIRKIVSLRIMKMIIDRFSQGEPAPDLETISSSLSIPMMLTRQTVETLVRCRLVSQVEGNGEKGFQPARDPSRITTAKVVEALEHEGESSFNPTKEPGFGSFARLHDTFQESLESSPANMPVKEITP